MNEDKELLEAVVELKNRLLGVFGDLVDIRSSEEFACVDNHLLKTLDDRWVALYDGVRDSVVGTDKAIKALMRYEHELNV